MSPVDAAWYHIDGPVNFAVVTAMLLTRKPLDVEQVKAVFRARLAGFDRFHQRVVETGFPIATPQWEDMGDFDLAQQIHHIALPEPRDRSALAALVGDLASQPLDRDRPLWQAWVVDDVDGGSAMILRIHHCMADGTATLEIGRALLDASPGRRGEFEPPPAASHRPRSGVPGFAWMLALVDRAGHGMLATTEAAVDAVWHPRRTMEKVASALDGATMLFSELLKPSDPQSPLKGEFGLPKSVAWSEPVALKDVKAIGAPSGAKVNDVLIAAMTGALRGYLRKRGIDVDRTTVRAMVPVDLRPAGGGQALGNAFGLVMLELPISSRRAADRLRLTKARMDALKRSPEPVAVLALFDLFGRGPKAIGDFAVDLFERKASVVMTNVAGPGQGVYLAGVPIDRMTFWVPHPGRQLGMGISILSYKGAATLALIADAHLVPDPDAIIVGFQREFGRMLRAVRRARAVAAVGD